MQQDKPTEVQNPNPTPATGDKKVPHLPTHLSHLKPDQIIKHDVDSVALAANSRSPIQKKVKTRPRSG